MQLASDDPRCDRIDDEIGTASLPGVCYSQLEWVLNEPDEFPISMVNS
jgi:hypothetical protein